MDKELVGQNIYDYATDIGGYGALLNEMNDMENSPDMDGDDAVTDHFADDYDAFSGIEFAPRNASEYSSLHVIHRNEVYLDTRHNPYRVVSAATAKSFLQICRHWRIVAIQDTYNMQWEWSLHNGLLGAQQLFHEAVAEGHVMTVQGRLGNGNYALYAKTVRGRRIPEAFRDFAKSNMIGKG